MRVGVLAVQGAFIEHEKILQDFGVECLELRNGKDVRQDVDGLILPGGESTTQGKLLRELDMFEPLREKIAAGLPVLATCAGLILLAGQLANDSARYFATLPVTVKRNAYGRQLGSFYTEEQFGDLGEVPMTFIRAPYIESAGEGVEILAKVHGDIVGVRYRNQIGLSFHPELDEDRRIHQMFLGSINGGKSSPCKKKAV
ncbi:MULTISPECIES: pyridoxal 5'-phosphate synthase glutaminase subunit PdxT [Desulfitobacterium]|uniref:Pyridoxal 5'-phosphate synthase subunit PdxT n=1 Tax=Desulfitobacterium dehalogenans (strain ATCC 51507 / DSM 9161 / JW/IU-DC1) TaxID=756499 RepID=I4A635_DESDJ|nr:MULTISPECIES: pyridoxal 5'-phosphate synthase glutaminase subunit PdxT [Desulfitobacterium]AFL99419.1 pyridoxal phosphate synthase yaaE subunit [Desulfitobacterium dehalogenans ATCC 51507]